MFSLLRENFMQSSTCCSNPFLFSLGGIGFFSVFDVLFPTHFYFPFKGKNVLVSFLCFFSSLLDFHWEGEVFLQSSTCFSNPFLFSLQREKCFCSLRHAIILFILFIAYGFSILILTFKLSLSLTLLLLLTLKLTLKSLTLQYT